MDELALCKELYYRELDRKASLTNALALPVGVGTLIASGLLYIARAVEEVNSAAELALTGLVCAGGISLLYSIYCIGRSYIGDTYRYAPNPIEIIEYKNELIEYYGTDCDTKRRAESEAIRYLTKTFAESGRDNSLNNDNKSSFLFKANRGLVVAVGFTLVAGISLTVGQFGFNPAEIRKILGIDW